MWAVFGIVVIVWMVGVFLSMLLDSLDLIDCEEWDWFAYGGAILLVIFLGVNGIIELISSM